MNNKALNRFFFRVGRTDSDCWLWLGYRHRQGYGNFWLDGRTVMAHVAIFEHVFGYQPTCVCHKCDNPPCVNPFHLFPGDQKLNRIDSILKGRGHSQKLSVEQILEIRELVSQGYRSGGLARKFKVDDSTISSIKHGHKWKHLKVRETNEVR